MDNKRQSTSSDNVAAPLQPSSKKLTVDSHEQTAAERRKLKAEKMKFLRHNETPEAKAERREKDAARKAAKLSQETPEEKANRLNRAAERRKAKRANKTTVQLQRRKKTAKRKTEPSTSERDGFTSNDELSFGEVETDPGNSLEMNFKSIYTNPILQLPGGCHVYVKQQISPKNATERENQLLDTISCNIKTEHPKLSNQTQSLDRELLENASAGQGIIRKLETSDDLDKGAERSTSEEKQQIVQLRPEKRKGTRTRETAAQHHQHRNEKQSDWVSLEKMETRASNVRSAIGISTLPLLQISVQGEKQSGVADTNEGASSERKTSDFKFTTQSPDKRKIPSVNTELISTEHQGPIRVRKGTKSKTESSKAKAEIEPNLVGFRPNKTANNDTQGKMADLLQHRPDEWRLAKGILEKLLQCTEDMSGNNTENEKNEEDDYDPLRLPRQYLSPLPEQLMSDEKRKVILDIVDGASCSRHIECVREEQESPDLVLLDSEHEETEVIPVNKSKQAVKRANETPEEKAERLKRRAEKRKLKLASETPEQRQERLKKAKMAKSRAKTDNSPYGLNISEEMVSTLCSLEAELEEGCTNSNYGEELMRLYALTPIFPLLYLNANICSSLIK